MSAWKECPSAPGVEWRYGHSFPADGEYKFLVQNFGLGKYTPGEQLQFLIDNELVETREYVGVGLSSGMQADTDGSIEVTLPVRAGSHMVGVTFLATNYRPTLDLVRQYERKSLENNAIPQLQYYPAIGLRVEPGSDNRKRRGRPR